MGRKIIVSFYVFPMFVVKKGQMFSLDFKKKGLFNLNMPRMLYNGNGVLPHLQMGDTEFGYPEYLFSVLSNL